MKISTDRAIMKLAALTVFNDDEEEVAAIDMAIEALSQPPADQWIPCSSGRLPKHKQQAFITVKLTESRRYVTTANYYTETGIVDECEWDGEGFYSYDSEYGYGRYENVIAWMPAEPYEGNEYEHD